MRGLKRDRTATIMIAGHGSMQNLRRGHYELGVLAVPGLAVAAALDDSPEAVDMRTAYRRSRATIRQRNRALHPASLAYRRRRIASHQVDVARVPKMQQGLETAF